MLCVISSTSAADGSHYHETAEEVGRTLALAFQINEHLNLNISPAYVDFWDCKRDEELLEQFKEDF